MSEGTTVDAERLTEVTEAALVRAKTLLLEGKFHEAAALYQEMLDGGSRWHPNGPHIAATSLGIAFGADGPNMDMAQSERYYLLGEELGSTAASYHLAGHYQRQGKLKEALQRFRLLAEEDASAAYWVYRLLSGDAHLKTYPDEDQHFLKIAIRNGHLLAKMDDVKRRIVGRDGLYKIPGAIAEYLGLFPKAYHAVRDEKKYLYS